MTDLFQHSFHFFDVVPNILYTIYFSHAHLTDYESFLELQLINFNNHTKEKGLMAEDMGKCPHVKVGKWGIPRHLQINKS